MKHKILVPALVLTILSAGIFGTGKVVAESSQGNYPPIIQKLVQKFGLKENEVQVVFDEARKERQTQMQTKFEERLNQIVADGKLNEAQKQMILAKHKELAEKRGTKPENWQNMTPEQRRQYMETQRQELEAWAKQNNIDLQYFLGGFGKGFGRMGHWQGK